MVEFIFLLLVVIVAIIAKFIYDSYLTDNTEKNWEKFKQTDPVTAQKIENSKIGINPIKQNPEVRNFLEKEKNRLVLAKMKFEFENYIDEHLERIPDDYPELSEDSQGIFNLTYLYEALTEIQMEFEGRLENLQITKTDFLNVLRDIADKRIESINRNYPSNTLWDDEERPDIIAGINQIFKDSNDKKEITKEEADKKLRTRSLLHQGINEGVLIDEISETVIFEKPDEVTGKSKESKGWIIYFHAVNRYYRKKAIEYFRAGNYEQALKQRLFVVVDDEEIQKYRNRTKVDILVDLKDFEGGEDEKDLVIKKVYFD